MAGTAPTGFQFTRKPDAGPVHCSVYYLPPQGNRIFSLEYSMFGFWQGARFNRV